LGIPWLHHKTWPFNICCPISFSKNSWIVIGFGLDCQSILKIGFWIFKHIFLLNLDWIDNPKKWIDNPKKMD